MKAVEGKELFQEKGLSGSDDEQRRLIDQCLKTLQGHSGLVRSVTFSPNGQILASGSGDQTVKIWSVSTGQWVQTLQGHTGSVRSVTFSPDGQILASSSDDRTIKLWGRLRFETGDELGARRWEIERFPTLQEIPDLPIMGVSAAKENK